ncbi:helix-turn-helix domain-containing protein [Streptomyces sp. NPDC057271]|uniref:helix-turn-helix domain-containing protein n=1 Tax=unclassified Streptomyces TaxID=2593676 RepID=UPI003628ECB3
MGQTKKTALGPTGETVRANVTRLRESQKLTYVELAGRLNDIDRPIPVLGLRRIERGERRVDADDLVALAVVFGVNPSALLLPFTVEGDTEITGVGTVPVRLAWDWADGESPLRTPEGDDGTAAIDFTRTARPAGLRSWSERFLPSLQATPNLERVMKDLKETLSQVSNEEVAQIMREVGRERGAPPQD